MEPDCVESNDEDEILSELKSCQQELKAISKQNRDVLKQLLNVAKEEMKKQEIRRKIDSVNTEVRPVCISTSSLVMLLGCYSKCCIHTSINVNILFS